MMERWRKPNLPAPQRAMQEFELDGVGDWVARLSCGHTQHVRHKPPFENRPWVLTEAGRREHVGAELPCKSCLMPTLPNGARVYKTTALFDGSSVPAGLLRSHQLKADVWGRIVVEQGYVLYTIEGTPELVFVLSERLQGIVPPEMPHHVAPRGDVRFRVEFLRCP